MFERLDLSQDGRDQLNRVVSCLSLLADVRRADLILFAQERDGRTVSIAQERPNSVSPLYEQNRVGIYVGGDDHSEVLAAFGGRVRPSQVHTVSVRGATVARQVWPVIASDGSLLAVLGIDSYWLAYERHRRRSLAFQRALREFTAMVLRGELRVPEGFGPFGEHDGVMFVGADKRVEYMSGIAQSLYRRLGFRDSIVGVPVSELDTADAQLVDQVLGKTVCLERQDEQYGLTWMRKGLPVSTTTRPRLAWLPVKWWGSNQPAKTRPYGVLVLIHDATEALEARRELESKTAMIREVHHRVKNNLQVITSLMRIQARRVTSPEARAVLMESVNRVLSVAVVHEFLSQNAQGSINLYDVAGRIISQVKGGLIDPNRGIRLSVDGSAVWLPSEQATRCALVINELVQNALEHGVAARDGGRIEVEMIDEGEHVAIVVSDDGEGLPEGFDLDTDAHLGLRIVRSMVERDLRGRFRLDSSEGTRAVVEFDKLTVGGN